MKSGAPDGGAMNLKMLIEMRGARKFYIVLESRANDKKSGSVAHDIILLKKGENLHRYGRLAKQCN
jgi:hypothetical protein